MILIITILLPQTRYFVKQLSRTLYFVLKNIGKKLRHVSLRKFFSLYKEAVVKEVAFKSNNKAVETHGVRASD